MSLRRAAAAVVLFAAATAAHAQFVINEGFNNVATLRAAAGSFEREHAARVDDRLVPGRPDDLHLQAGAPQAYVAANYNNAPRAARWRTG